MSASLKKVSIRGFKSINELEDFELGKLSVLIGANGAGKSNFIDFFRLLRAMADEQLQKFITTAGGADGFFHLGPQFTRQIEARLEFGLNLYEFELTPTADSGLQIKDERVRYTGGDGQGGLQSLGGGVRESNLKKSRDSRSIWTDGLGVPHYVFESVANWTVYHFHDTSIYSPMRREHLVSDNESLRPDASNIAAYLLALREKSPSSYDLIRDTVRMIAPFFDDFLLRPTEKAGRGEGIRLEWHQKGTDYPFQPFHLSDGTIRFICLATALQQPTPPATMLLDEPELGLHPFAISLLADLTKSAAAKTQVIVATQSPILLDEFDAEEVVVVTRDDSNSRFERLDSEKLGNWLKDYSVGELWQKNVVRGSPAS